MNIEVEVEGQEIQIVQYDRPENRHPLDAHVIIMSLDDAVKVRNDLDHIIRSMQHG